MRLTRIGSSVVLMGVSLAAQAGPEGTVSGDFDGDGKRDVVVIIDDAGMTSVDFYEHVGSGFPVTDQLVGPARWATRQGDFWKAQKWFGGDFNGDGKDDLAKVFDCNGTACIDVHLSNGSSFSTMQRWATNQGSIWSAQKWLVGDFNGDGRSDLAKAFSEGGSGSVDVHLSSGSAFSMQRWATGQGGFGDAHKWFAGDFNGDGFTDVGKAFGESGQSSIDIHVSNGSSFIWQRWTTRQGGFWNDQRWYVGDYDGDGRDDAVLLYERSGGMAGFAIHRSVGSGFAAAIEWPDPNLSFSASGTFEAGDFTGDGLADLVRWNAGTPQLRRNIGGGWYLNCTIQNEAHYAGFVQCGFASGFGSSSFYEEDSTSQWAAPRYLYNAITGQTDLCIPMSPTPFSHYEQVQVCN